MFKTILTALVAAVISTSVSAKSTAYFETDSITRNGDTYTLRSSGVHLGKAPHLVAFKINGENVLSIANSKNRKAIRFKRDDTFLSLKINWGSLEGVRDYLTAVSLKAAKVGKAGHDCSWDNWSVNTNGVFKYKYKLLLNKHPDLNDWLDAAKGKYARRVVQDVAWAVCMNNQ